MSVINSGIISSFIMYRLWLLLPIILISCNSSILSRDIYTETENKYDTTGNKREFSGQVIKIFRKSDKKLIASLTKIYNYNDDYKVLLTTGLSKKDGLSDFLLDSTFHDKNGNDTLKKSYVNRKGKWVQTQYFRKIYRTDSQIQYSKTERLNDKAKFLKEVFYQYNSLDKLISETEYMCSKMVNCDSSFKKEYFYSSGGRPDSTRFLFWKDNHWVYHRTFIKTKKDR